MQNGYCCNLVKERIFDSIGKIVLLLLLHYTQDNEMKYYIHVMELGSASEFDLVQFELLFVLDTSISLWESQKIRVN